MEMSELVRSAVTQSTNLYQVAVAVVLPEESDLVIQSDGVDVVVPFRLQAPEDES